MIAVCLCAEAERLVSSMLKLGRCMLKIAIAALFRSLGLSSRLAGTIGERMPNAASSIRYEKAVYASSPRAFWWRESPHDGVWGKMWVLVCGSVPLQALRSRYKRRKGRCSRLRKPFAFKGLNGRSERIRTSDP